MRRLILLAFVACSQHPAAVVVDAPPDVAAPPACVSCASLGEYCYQGELAAGTYYPSDGNVQEGCNVPPTSCGTCDCLMHYFSPGFCSCAVIDGGASVTCSLI